MLRIFFRRAGTTQSGSCAQDYRRRLAQRQTTEPAPAAGRLITSTFEQPGADERMRPLSRNRARFSGRAGGNCCIADAEHWRHAVPERHAYVLVRRGRRRLRGRVGKTPGREKPERPGDLQDRSSGRYWHPCRIRASRGLTGWVCPSEDRPWSQSTGNDSLAGCCAGIVLSGAGDQGRPVRLQHTHAQAQCPPGLYQFGTN